MTDGTCPKCGSAAVVAGVRILDRGHGNSEYDLQLAVYARPDAWVFKNKVTGKLRAYVCGECGYTEFYATNLPKLLDAAARALQRETPTAPPPPDDASS